MSKRTPFPAKRQSFKFMLKTIAIIQARMSSSRLPGKVLLPIAERPMLAWVVERTRRAQTVN